MNNEQIQEIWKDMPDYVGLYQVSNLGRVRSLDRMIGQKGGGKQFKSGRILRPRNHPHGYVFISLYKDGIANQVLIHRLVAIVFIPNPSNLPEVNHKNFNKKDNFVENLEWMTTKDNTRHAFAAGKINTSKGDNHFRSIVNSEKVIDMIKLFNSGIKMCDIARKFQVSYPCVFGIVKRKNWKHVIV
jgi:hypothetical protein